MIGSSGPSQPEGRGEVWLAYGALLSGVVLLGLTIFPVREIVPANHVWLNSALPVGSFLSFMVASVASWSSLCGEPEPSTRRLAQGAMAVALVFMLLETGAVVIMGLLFAAFP